MAKKIFVTGPSGFIGRNLIEGLKQHYQIYAVPHAQLELLDANAVKSYLDRTDVDIIIHCANIGGTRRTKYDVGSIDVIEKNLRIFFNLIRCLKPNVQLFHFGSGAEYNKNAYIPKMGEDFFDTSVPQDPYGFSKYLISKYIETAPNITCLRLFGIYGKYEDYSYKFISNAIVKNLLHLPITIQQNVVFDYLFIDDLVEIIKKMLEVFLKNKHINVTPTDSIDLLSIAKIINEISDFRSEIVVLNSGLNREYTGSNKRLLGEIGDFQFTSYREGILRLYNYYASNLESLDTKIVKEDPYLKYCTKTENSAKN